MRASIFFQKISRLTASLLLIPAILSCFCITAKADKTEDRIKANQAITIESNTIANWPAGPVTNAESAILMDYDTGVILYEKNIHAREYPASTTKILTTLIALEECSLDEKVVFSHDAVFGIPHDSNHVAMNVGDSLTVEQCLQAILIRSANEVSYAIAEHIDGDWDTFADRMNARAKELGCVDSHFVNPNGLPDDDHYTSAYDLAMIGRAFFANELLCQITQMPYLRLSKSNGDLVDANQMQLLAGKPYAYPYLVGCKTGYTESARSCLVSCAEKEGMRLICVVLKDEAPHQYEDTITLFNYGFANFDKVNISQTETKYNIENRGFYSDNDVFGNSKPILSLNTNDSIVLPKTVDFEDIDSRIDFTAGNAGQVAVIHYSYHGISLGDASVDFAVNTGNYAFDAEVEKPKKKFQIPPVIFVNVLKVSLWLAGIALSVTAVVLIIRFRREYNRRHPNSRRNWKKERRKQRNYARSMYSAKIARKRQAMQQIHRRNKKNRRWKL